MRKECEEGQHVPDRSTVMEPQGRCIFCRAYERDIWAHGEQLWRHMHRYSGEGDVLTCDCGARISRWMFDKHMAEGKASRERRLAHQADVA